MSMEDNLRKVQQHHQNEREFKEAVVKLLVDISRKLDTLLDEKEKED